MNESIAGDKPRSYGCSYGCGNPYDVIMVDIKNSETTMLCIPCFLQLAKQILDAMMNPDDPTVQAAVAGMAEAARNQAPGPSGSAARRNDPVDADGVALFDDEIDGDYMDEMT